MGVGPACRRFVRYYRNRVFRAFFHALPEIGSCEIDTRSWPLQGTSETAANAADTAIGKPGQARPQSGLLRGSRDSPAPRTVAPARGCMRRDGPRLSTAGYARCLDDTADQERSRTRLIIGSPEPRGPIRFDHGALEASATGEYIAAGGGGIRFACWRGDAGLCDGHWPHGLAAWPERSVTLAMAWRCPPTFAAVVALFVNSSG
jgi:hypothetical protein